MYENPLDSIRIASPCTSDWNEMHGDERRRFCAACKLNVYNLSGMTRQEAESLLINTEGRLCVRFYRRRDGTVLTADCPVGWRAIKQRASKTSLAVCSLIAGFLTGMLSVRAPESAISYLHLGDVPAVEEAEEERVFSEPIIGEFEDYEEWEGRVDMSGRDRLKPNLVHGRVERIAGVENRKVKAWIK